MGSQWQADMTLRRGHRALKEMNPHFAQHNKNKW